MGWHRQFWVSIFLFILVVVFGAYVYSSVEGWSMLDSIYFVVVTVTTIGYGDLFPITSAGKIFTIFFSFFGIAFAFYFVSMIGSRVLRAHLSERVSEIKEVVKREQEAKIELRKKRKK